MSHPNISSADVLTAQISHLFAVKFAEKFYLFFHSLTSVRGLQGNAYWVDDSAFQGVSLRDILLTLAYPVDKVTLWKGPSLLNIGIWNRRGSCEMLLSEVEPKKFNWREAYMIIRAYTDLWAWKCGMEHTSVFMHCFIYRPSAAHHGWVLFRSILQKNSFCSAPTAWICWEDVNC